MREHDLLGLDRRDHRVRDSGSDGRDGTVREVRDGLSRSGQQRIKHLIGGCALIDADRILRAAASAESADDLSVTYYLVADLSIGHRITVIDRNAGGTCQAVRG